MIILICLISEGMVMKLNKSLEETLTDDEEFELFQDLVVEMSENKTTETATDIPEEEEEEDEEYSTNLPVLDEEEEEDLVDDIIEGLGDDLVEIVGDRRVRKTSVVYIVVGASAVSVLVVVVMVALAIFKIKTKNETSSQNKENYS